MYQLAILDDYQGVARGLADWDSLPGVVVSTFHRHLEADELVERLRPFHVVVAMRERTPFPRSVLEALPDLQLLVTTGAQNASIDLAAARDLGVVVCSTGGSGAPTAELTWGLILALGRHILTEDAGTRAGRWQRTVGLQLAGSTLGLIGLGRVGGLVAEVGLAFGMEVVAWSQNLTQERADEVGVRRVERDELLASSDVVSIHLQLSDRTRGLISAADLQAMKRSSLLVNTSRGPIVDEDALVQALEGGWIAGAALDVFDAEPLPAGHRLATVPNTVLTPHLGYVTETNYRTFYRHAVDDVRAFLAGSPVRVLS